MISARASHHYASGYADLSPWGILESRLFAEADNYLTLHAAGHLRRFLLWNMT